MKSSLLKLIYPVYSFFRLLKIQRAHSKCVKLLNQIIWRCENENFESIPLKVFNDEKIIWQYWGQNDDSIPDVVKLCFESIDLHKGDYKIIRLNDSNISEYIKYPEYIYNKLQTNNSFNRTFFSDLLRVSLLKSYGGVWLDATIYLTNPLPEKYHNMEYFMFQRDPKEVNKKYWSYSYAAYWGWSNKFRVNVLSSIIFAKKDNIIIKKLEENLLKYWKTQDSLVNYFVFQILYDILISNEYSKNRCVIESDVLPHLLQNKINGGNLNLNIDDILKLTGIHKMSYFNDDALIKFVEFDSKQKYDNNKLTVDE